MSCGLFDSTGSAFCVVVCFFFQAEDGIRYLVRSRGLGDVYKRQLPRLRAPALQLILRLVISAALGAAAFTIIGQIMACLLYTSDAADERSSVDLGGRRIIKKKTVLYVVGYRMSKREHT